MIAYREPPKLGFARFGEPHREPPKLGFARFGEPRGGKRAVMIVSRGETNEELTASALIISVSIMAAHIEPPFLWFVY